MDKYEYQLKTEHIKQVAARKEYDEAARLCDTIDWTKVRDVKMLTMVAEIYAAVGEYDDAIDILQQAYQYATMGRRILYRLTELALKADSYEDAKSYFEEFCRIAPNDQGRYILLYKMARSQKATLEEKIKILEAYKREDFDEKWAYELAVLYAMNEQKDKCVQLCDDIILWFGLGKYVEKALGLKSQFAPLTAAQKEKAQKLADKKKQEEQQALQEEEQRRQEQEKARREAEEQRRQEQEKARQEAEEQRRQEQENARQAEEQRPPEEKKYSSVVTSDMKTIMAAINRARREDAGLPPEEPKKADPGIQTEIRENVKPETKPETNTEEKAEEKAEEKHGEQSESIQKKPDVKSRRHTKAKQEAEPVVRMMARPVETLMQKAEENPPVIESEYVQLAEEELFIPENYEEAEPETQEEVYEEAEPAAEEEVCEEPASEAEEEEEVCEEAEPEAEEEEEVYEETEPEAEEEVYEETEPEAEEEVYEEAEPEAEEEVYEEDEPEAEEEVYEEDEPKLPIENPDNLSAVWHFAIQVPPGEDDIGTALSYLQELADNSPRAVPESVVKITGKKLNQKGVIQSLDKLLGKTILIENAGDIDERVADEFCKILDPTDRSLLVVFIDTPASIRRLLATYPRLSQAITAQFIRENYSIGELLDYARGYADREDSVLDQSGELALMERLKVIAGNQERDKKRIVEIIMNNAIERAEKRSVRRLFQTKYNKNGCLILRDKDFEVE